MWSVICPLIVQDLKLERWHLGYYKGMVVQDLKVEDRMSYIKMRVSLCRTPTGRMVCLSCIVRMSLCMS
jgi:hypothetical protein